MTTDLETIRWAAGLIIAALCCVLWWNFRELTNDHKKTKEDAANFKLYVAQNYATNNDLGKTVQTFERVVERIEQKIDLLFDRIDSKQDKPR